MRPVINELTNWVGHMRYAIASAKQSKRLVQVDPSDAEHLLSTLRAAISEIARLERIGENK